MPPYVVLEKAVGETPLSCMEAWRSLQPSLTGVPLAYAGRLDPMASGKLLVLIGEECKRQHEYHGLDKAYEVEALMGVSSDSGDVLGIIEETTPAALDTNWHQLAPSLTGTITLPYPAYSAKTVAGVPLHTWAVTGRLHEVSIPARTSTVYSLTITASTTRTRADLYEQAQQKINLLPTVTDERKALGNDFRRPQVRAAWNHFYTTGAPTDSFTVVCFTCICSSGTYMRTLADLLAHKAGSHALALAIHRTIIGTYNDGIWTTTFT